MVLMKVKDIYLVASVCIKLEFMGYKKEEIMVARKHGKEGFRWDFSCQGRLIASLESESEHETYYQ